MNVENAESISLEVEGSLGQKLAGKYMTFKLAKEEYGLEILKVREIIGLMDITRIPRSPDFVRGVINLRGKVIPVIDLRLKFNMSPAEATEQTVIIVVQYGAKNQDISMGILVDEVVEVLGFNADQIEPAPAFGNEAIETEYIFGVGKFGQRVLFLLDIARVLSLEETHAMVSTLEST
jgi:purine-binding chemotaxis protein CheW